MRHFTNDGPFRGPLLDGIWPDAIGVLEAPDRPMPIGTALVVGRDAAGIALWELVVHDEVVPGRWIVVDREFHPAQGNAPRLDRAGRGIVVRSGAGEDRGSINTDRSSSPIRRVIGLGPEDLGHVPQLGVIVGADGGKGLAVG
jgi:hypothetical protein